MSHDASTPANLLIFHDRRADLHDTGPGHPEHIERLAAVLGAAREACTDRRPVTPEQAGWRTQSRVLQAAQAVYATRYIDRLPSACAAHKNYINTLDSAVCPDTFEAAIASTACGLAAVESVVVKKTCRTAFVAMRPPGHHCEHSRLMGFCLLNNIAVAAYWLLANADIERVAIVDFDVHHGNGTQHAFDALSDVFYILTHQHPATMYPGTGYGHEVRTLGTPGYGHTLNILLDFGTGEAEALAAYNGPIARALNAYMPQVLLISAGFDADRRDPLANLRWDAAPFEKITRIFKEITDRHCDGQIISLLEGGYDLHALAEGVGTHFAVLAETS